MSDHLVQTAFITSELRTRLTTAVLRFRDHMVTNPPGVLIGLFVVLSVVVCCLTSFVYSFPFSMGGQQTNTGGNIQPETVLEHSHTLSTETWDGRPTPSGARAGPWPAPPGRAGRSRACYFVYIYIYSIYLYILVYVLYIFGYMFVIRLISFCYMLIYFVIFSLYVCYDGP